LIHGIGVDLVKVERLRLALDRHGDAFAQRLLAEKEYEEYQRVMMKAAFLAKRFAAKEAFAKALGTGFAAGLHWRDVSVTHDERGRPALKLQGRARELFAESGATACYLSIADEKDYAIAYVVLEYA
jgi:holo-[acyl-carrier protein] synthase